jgi:transposase
MLADELDYVVGVDTHRDQHVLSVVAAPTGAVVAQRAVAASGRGYAHALRFANEHGRGARVWAVEGVGHYGLGIVRFLSDRGETVLEAGRSPRGERRLQGKDDGLDATRAARAALGSDELALPRAGQRREALRLLLLARRSAVEVRRRALVQLRSVIVTAPDRLREQLQELPERRLLERCSRFRRSSSCPVDELASKVVLRTLAQRIEAATAEAEQLERELLAHVRALAPRLLDEPGVGPIVAADVIVAWSHPGRVRSEAAFARLAGVAPVPASSGQTVRHRLSRGGDRQLNRALHTVVLHRRQHDPTTQANIERRVAEGKSRREATRLLKRYLARHLYRMLQQTEPLMT